MKIAILSAAVQDIEAGRVFYEKQLAELGSEFVQSVLADIEALESMHGIHPVQFECYHRLLTRRFPFAVYYTFDSTTVYVWAVLDCRRNPRRFRERLGGGAER